MLARWNKNELPCCLNRATFTHNEGGIAENTALWLALPVRTVQKHELMGLWPPHKQNSSRLAEKVFSVCWLCQKEIRATSASSFPRCKTITLGMGKLTSLCASQFEKKKRAPFYSQPSGETGSVWPGMRRTIVKLSGNQAAMASKGHGSHSPPFMLKTATFSSRPILVQF